MKLEVPATRSLFGFVSYANMHGTASLPVTGGLLLDGDAAAAFSGTDRFPISQDQRDTFRARVNYQLSPRARVAAEGSYGSGLPVEFVGDLEDAVEQYGPRIAARVDVAKGRVRPSASLDASASYAIVNTAKRRVRVQADVDNLTNRLNVTNFAGLFSGTALAPPRTVTVRVQAEF